MRCKALYIGPYAEYVFLMIPQILEFQLASALKAAVSETLRIGLQFKIVYMIAMRP